MIGKIMAMLKVNVFLFFLFLRQASSIRISELTIPSHAVDGGSVLLQCRYDLEGEMLYSIKWYKDNREFFRFVPNNAITFSYFPLPGVLVDEKDSSSNIVKLVNLTAQSAGLYRCEVSGEGPYFVTVFDEKNISVHLLPYDRPQVTGLQEEYKVNEILAVNCTSSRSRPQAQLKWLINNEAAPRRNITGPWYRVSRERPDARETIMQLRFIVRQEHFTNGVLQLKCQSSIAPLYQDETIHHIVRAEDSIIDPISEEVLNEEINKILDQTATDGFVGEVPIAESQNDRDNTSVSGLSLTIGVMMILSQIFL